MTQPGAAYFADPDGSGQHLWVVIGRDPNPGGGVVLVLVNVTTMRPGADRTCVLNQGEPGMHAFIRHESWIFYRKMRTFQEAELQAAERTTGVSPVLLRRIQSGAHRSPHTPKGLKAIIPIPAPTPEAAVTRAADAMAAAQQADTDDVGE